MFFKRQISTLFAKAPWSWGRMHNILSCILLEGRKIESRRQLNLAIALRSKRKERIGNETNKHKNARPPTTTDARTGALGNGLDLKLLKV